LKRRQPPGTKKRKGNCLNRGLRRENDNQLEIKKRHERKRETKGLDTVEMQLGREAEVRGEAAMTEVLWSGEPY